MVRDIVKVDSVRLKLQKFDAFNPDLDELIQIFSLLLFASAIEKVDSVDAALLGWLVGLRHDYLLQAQRSRTLTHLVFLLLFSKIDWMKQSWQEHAILTVNSLTPTLLLIDLHGPVQELEGCVVTKHYTATLPF